MFDKIVNTPLSVRKLALMEFEVSRCCHPTLVKKELPFRNNWLEYNNKKTGFNIQNVFEVNNKDINMTSSDIALMLLMLTMNKFSTLN